MVNPTLLAANLVGVAVFAASGASAGVAKRLDIFGVIFVGVVAALGGGIARDVLLGAVPPFALTHWPYFTVAVAASLLLFWLHPQFDRLRRTVLILDAAGLGLFTVTGTLRRSRRRAAGVGACVDRHDHRDRRRARPRPADRRDPDRTSPRDLCGAVAAGRGVPSCCRLGVPHAAASR